MNLGMALGPFQACATCGVLSQLRNERHHCAKQKKSTRSNTQHHRCSSIVVRSCSSRSSPIAAWSSVQGSGPGLRLKRSLRTTCGPGVPRVRAPRGERVVSDSVQFWRERVAREFWEVCATTARLSQSFRIWEAACEPSAGMGKEVP